MGINTAITSQTGSYVGYSFAVPSNIAKKVIQDILEYGNVQKGFMGIRPAPTNTRDAIEKGINNIDGVYIELIEEESAAQEAGIEIGEVKNLTAHDKKVYKTKTGVKIIGVPERYRGYGLSEKVIVKIDDIEIGNIDDAYNAFGGISKYDKTVITMLGPNGERDRLIFQ